jgi:hypothetical protein
MLWIPAATVCSLKGEADMTKAKARERAKAKAKKKPRKPEADADQPGQKAMPPGKFDPGSGSIKGPRVNANIKSFGGARRGSARSK